MADPSTAASSCAVGISAPEAAGRGLGRSSGGSNAAEAFAIRLRSAAQANMRLGPPLPSGENRLAALPSPTQSGGECRAILLTGDSNLRELFHLLAESL